MENVNQPLDPVVISLGPITVHWYGLIIGTAIFLGLLIAMRESEKRGLNKGIFTDLTLIAVPISIISARIYYVVFEWPYYSKNPEQIIQIWNGGIAIHGALIGAVTTAYFFAKYKKVSFWKLADIAAPSIILGQAIGRWGNFMNQEAFGGVVSKGFLENLILPEFIIKQMYIAGAYHHPTFLYESIWNLAGFLLLLILRRTQIRQGELFLSYLIWYSCGRFFIEGIRTDSLMLFGVIRMAQLLSVLLIVGSILVIIVRRRKKYRVKKYKDSLTNNEKMN